jgi:hypothetical protein
VKSKREISGSPVRRNTFCDLIKVWNGAPTATEVESGDKRSKVLEDNLATG